MRKIGYLFLIFSLFENANADSSLVGSFLFGGVFMPMDSAMKSTTEIEPSHTEGLFTAKNDNATGLLANKKAIKSPYWANKAPLAGMKINIHLFLSNTFKAGVHFGVFNFSNMQMPFKIEHVPKPSDASNPTQPIGLDQYVNMSIGPMYFGGLEFTANIQETLLLRFSFGLSVASQSFLVADNPHNVQSVNDLVPFNNFELNKKYGVLFMFEGGIQFNDDDFIFFFVACDVGFAGLKNTMKLKGYVETDSVNINLSRLTFLAGIGIALKIK